MAPADKLHVVSGRGVGDVHGFGQQHVAIDTAQDGFPEGVIDVLLIPAGALQPIAALQIPRGSIIMFLDPATAAQVRAHAFKGRPPVNGPAVPNTIRDPRQANG